MVVVRAGSNGKRQRASGLLTARKMARARPTPPSFGAAVVAPYPPLLEHKRVTPGPTKLIITSPCHCAISHSDKHSKGKTRVETKNREGLA